MKIREFYCVDCGKKINRSPATPKTVKRCKECRREHNKEVMKGAKKRYNKRRLSDNSRFIKSKK